MKKYRLLIYIILALAILTSLAVGIFLGDPQNMRVETSGL
jgi:hypothetical protein